MKGFGLVALACVAAIAAAPAADKNKKKKKEEETQTLQLPKELPSATVGETRRLTFHVTPLSSKGLLSAQIREALKALMKETGGNQVLKIRAFTAGSGDLRRVRDLVSEVFTDRKQSLPVLSLIQSGGLPLEGAQVVLEAIAAGKKEVSPFGLVFLSALPAVSANPLDAVAPLAAKSLESLRQTVKTAGSEAADVVRITCFLSSLENVAATRKLVEAEYPHAAANYVQTQRAPNQALAACEAVARLKWNTGTRLQLMNVEGAQPEPGESQIALVAARHVVLTGTQVSFGYQEQDSRLALGRLQKALEGVGASPADVAFAHYYPLSFGIANQVRKLRATFFNAAHPPAGSMLLFEGLPSMDAGFAVDVVAVKE
jgi:enamine deaminase RidA (YjgF/YER057c/UK114 family)